MRILLEVVSKTILKSWETILFLPIQEADDFIIEAYQVDQAQLPLGESTLAIPDVFLLPGNEFQGELLHHHPRDRAETDQPAILQIHLLALFEDRSDT